MDFDTYTNERLNGKSHIEIFQITQKNSIEYKMHCLYEDIFYLMLQKNQNKDISYYEKMFYNEITEKSGGYIIYNDILFNINIIKKIENHINTIDWEGEIVN